MSKYLAGLLNFWLFIAFILGVIAGKQFSAFYIFFIFSLLSISGSYFFYKKKNLFISDTCIFLFFISAGALWQIPCSVGDLGNLKGKENLFQVKVISLPEQKDLENTFFAYVEPADSFLFGRRIRVVDYTRGMEYLHSYKVKGKLGKKQFSGRDFYCFWVKKNTVPQELPMNSWETVILKVNSYFLSIFKHNLNDESYAFLASIFLGRRELLGEEKDFFADAGISHLLAISGQHMVIIAMILFFMLRFFYIKHRTRLLISIICLWFYFFLTGSSPSILRSVIMYSVFALSFFAKTKTDALNSLGLAGIISLVVDPLSLYDIGFQLSFISVFALIIGFRFYPVRPAKNTVLNHAKQILIASLWVSLLINPIVSYYFGRVQLLNIFYNIIFIPFFTFILVINFLLIIFAPLKFIAQAIGEVLNVLIFSFIRLADILGSLKLSFIPYSFPPAFLWLYYSLICVVSFFIRHIKGTKLTST